MKKPTLLCCFTWIVFIELNFTVAFLLIWKTWDDQFAGKVGDGDFKKYGDPSNGGDDFEIGGWYLYMDYAQLTKFQCHTFFPSWNIEQNVLLSSYLNTINYIINFKI